MRLLRPWRPLLLNRTAARPCWLRSPRLTLSTERFCSCSAPLALTATHALQAKDAKKHVQHPGIQESPDHRTIGTTQGLWTQHPSSPGSPFFLPAGAHIFQKLIEFLRAQYPAYGFHEVVTPTLYKQYLWEQSGHWANYKDEMFTVKGSSANEVEKEEYGLKPMNCPGHCLLFASQSRSYRDLPIRYADFSPLHRNEISGALSGLTRVRRFHQDDGHIFCRPNQIQKEVKDQLQFVNMVYTVFGLKIHKVLLSTRPEESYMGEMTEWESAEQRLKEALDQSEMAWSVNPGDGAFYGPKIDVIVQDSDGKEHQTATIQLDFQLPKRFELAYADGEQTLDEQSISRRSEPVMIHRALFGSLERFMALLTEHYNGRWPFWLSPNQVMILTVSDNPEVMEYVEAVATLLRNAVPQVRQKLDSPTYSIDVDSSGDSVGKKIARAKNASGAKYPVICVLGQKNVQGNFLDLDFSGMRNQEEVWGEVEKCRPGSQIPVQTSGGTRPERSSGIRMAPSTFVEVMRRWTDNYL